MTTANRQLRVAMIGHGFMGAAHSQAWRVAPRFFELAAHPSMDVLVGRAPEATANAAARWGWDRAETDWRRVVKSDDVDVIDIVTPGDSHAEIAIAALDNGKHVLCEKPMANSVEEAELMVAAANRAAQRGVFAMVGYTYRRVPAVTLARQMVRDGRVGDIRQVRASYLQDWLVDEEAPLTWRLQRDRAGSGALGDIGAHAIDLAQFVTGLSLTAVAGTLETLVAERPVMAETRGLAGIAGSGRGEVTVDDVALFAGRFDTGVLGSFEASRFSTGRKNALRLEVAGSKGAISFDLEDLDYLWFYDATDPDLEQGFRRISVTEPTHPYMSAWWPAGHLIGYEHAFSHQVRDFVEALTVGDQPHPSFDDALQVQKVLAAVETSSGAGGVWTTI